MTGSVNKALLIGNLGRDPEIRSTQSGDKVANLSLATSESWKDKQSGDRKERTEWHRVVIFGPLAEVAEKYLRKGSKVYLEGQIQTRKWTDQSGQDKYTTEVVLSGPRATLVMLDAKPERAERSQGPGERAAAAECNDPADQGPLKSGGDDDLDSEIPF